MEKFLLTPRIIPGDDALAALSEAWSDDRDLIDKMWKHASDIAAPRAIIRECKVNIIVRGSAVEIDGVSIKSGLMAENFAELDVVYPYAVSCGRELYEWYLSLDDMIEQYIADEISKIYLYKMVDFVYGFMNEKFVPDGRLASMNPGSLPDAWTLTGQRELFSILKTADTDVGITLTESCLMLPSKSLSGIFFASDTEYENCMYCPRIRCPRRRADFAGRAI